MNHTALSIGNEAAARKPALGKFGCKTVEHIVIRPITILPTVPKQEQSDERR